MLDMVRKKKGKLSMHFDPILLMKSFATGFIAGGIFTLLKLPIPAPTEFASIVGILGAFSGFLVLKFFLH